jgi:phospholipase C
MKAKHAGAGAASALPEPHKAPIEHIVVVMMENRSFDHLFGWIPTADGVQSGLSYTDPEGLSHSTYALAPDYTGCGFKDPDHSYEGGRMQYQGGAMDGFLLDPGNDDYAIGYYVEEDRPFYSELARNYTTLNHAFCSILGPTFPNRLFLHSAQTDRLSNTANISTLPTIWDRLAAAGASGTYYFSNLPFLGLWGAKYVPISRPYQQFLLDASSGKLPNVSFVDPRFTVADDGTGNDDHPHADIRSADAFLADTFSAVVHSPAWARTVFIVTYDEWGGFFDHVAPPRVVAANNMDPDIVNGKTLLGFRVPVVVASLFCRGTVEDPRVISSLFDHTSVLKLIEWKWNLVPLTPRDASREIRNLARALNFQSPDASVPDLPHPVAPPPMPCGQLSLPGAGVAAARGAEAGGNEWARLLHSGVLDPWNL